VETEFDHFFNRERKEKTTRGSSYNGTTVETTYPSEFSLLCHAVMREVARDALTEHFKKEEVQKELRAMFLAQLPDVVRKLTTGFIDNLTNIAAHTIAQTLAANVAHTIAEAFNDPTHVGRYGS
jgi:hypothetical protein